MQNYLTTNYYNQKLFAILGGLKSGVLNSSGLMSGVLNSGGLMSGGLKSGGLKSAHRNNRTGKITASRLIHQQQCVILHDSLQYVQVEGYTSQKDIAKAVFISTQSGILYSSSN